MERSSRLLERARAGDRDALETLYRRYLPPLQAWARGRVPQGARNVMDTDDLVQETLVSSLKRVDRFEPKRTGAFQAYLRQSVLNRLRDEIRRVRRRPLNKSEVDELPDEHPSPVDHAMGREVRQRYESALETLSEQDREGVVARLELGMSWAEVASLTDRSSPDAARMAVTRCLVKIAQAMADG